MLSSQHAPDLVDQSLTSKTDAVTSLATQCLQNLQKGISIDEGALEAAINNATIPWSGSTSSALQKALIQASNAVLPSYQKLLDTVEGQCQVLPGS